MKLDRLIHREWICKYISSEYGSEERRFKYFRKYLAGAKVKRWQEFDNIYDLFKKYGPHIKDVSEHVQAECVHRWIPVLYDETEFEGIDFLKSFESFKYVDGPGCFGGFKSDEELMQHLRGNYKFRCVLQSTSLHLPKYKINEFPDRLSKSTLKGFIIPRDKGDD